MTEQQCNCGSSAAANNKLVGWTTLFAALGVCTACCLLPFVLISLGAAGTWISTLEGLARYKWPFISIAALLLSYGLYVVYKRPKSRSVRAALWIATVIALSGIAFEQVEPMLATAR